MLILNRIVSDFISTRGVIVSGRVPLAHTLELPSRNNARNISCIPAGKYRLTKASSPKFARCFYVHDVPNRSGILIHVGNSLLDTDGCILVGLDVNGDHIVNSRLAMDRLYSVLPDDNILEVRNA